jgi:hypothetical protein
VSITVAAAVPANMTAIGKVITVTDIIRDTGTQIDDATNNRQRTNN